MEPIRLRFTDLLSDARRRHSPALVGRDRELRHLVRTVARRSTNNILMIGIPGVGKTALVEGCAAYSLHSTAHLPGLPWIHLDAVQLATMLRQGGDMVTRARAALNSLPASVVWVDDADDVLKECGEENGLFSRLFRPFIERSDLRLLLTVNQDTVDACEDLRGEFARSFDTLLLKELPPADQEQIVRAHLSILEKGYGVRIDGDVPAAAVRLSQHLSETRACPDRILRLLDEACAECSVAGERHVTTDALQAVVADRTGIPRSRLGDPERDMLRTLPATLKQRVRGQDHAIERVAEIVQRGWLGLRSASRPIGSFLFLGPSGVGKTECARALADLVYGNGQAVVRLDMSEFADAHTRQRLIGAPPGYVGHESGGQLTNPIAERPFSLILLDEIEKAHPSIFDLFLQVLEDGRLTDGKGQTVDFTKTIIIATSNLCVDEILRATESGQSVTTQAFTEQVVLPKLLQSFRAEFLNRFDAIVPFRALDAETLFAIARYELFRIEERVAAHNMRFRISDTQLQQIVSRFSAPRFGVRPLKRFLEQTCERLVSEQLLDNAREVRR